jgi:uncharacterized membrane protein YebE (DUF533 family)
MNPFDILGAVMQAGMSPSSGNRMGDLLGQMMGGGAPGGAPGAAPGGMPGGGGPGALFDMLGKMAGGALGGGQGGGVSGMGGMPGAGGGFPAEILKQVAGAVLGGGQGQGNAGAGLGSMAIFGTLAAQALDMAKGMMSGGPAAAGGIPQPRLDPHDAVIAGMRPPQNPQEQQQVLDMATLTLRAMMTAMKADGRVDEKEKEKLLGKLQQGGISAEEQAFVNAEMQKPIDLDAIVRDVPNQQAAAQIYAASLTAIEVDTDSERRYLADLAAKLQLPKEAVAYMHKRMGIA